MVKTICHGIVGGFLYFSNCRTLVRQFALNLINLEPSKKSLAVKQKVAGWDEEFLLSVLLNTEI